MKVSYVLLTRNRRDDVVENLESLAKQRYPEIEVVLVVNASEDDTASVVRSRFPHVRVIESKTNTGVTGGRNLGMRAARGDILIIVDDDAVLKDPLATSRVVAEFEKNEKLGVLAFQERSYFNPEVILHWDFPGRVPEQDATQAFETYFFVGVGHAIRASALQKTGLYPEQYFYSTEEKDLAFRMLDRGFEIWYTPRVQVFHKVSPTSRDYNRGYHELRNHIWFGMRLLPWPQAIGYATVWFGYVTVKSFPRHLPFVYRALRDAWKTRRDILKERRPVSRATLAKMRRLRPTRSDVRKRFKQLTHL
jgi:GT2 family glycosyltransferase